MVGTLNSMRMDCINDNNKTLKYYMNNLQLYHILEETLRMEDSFCSADGQVCKDKMR